ncbi:MexH family multidrug efflux RND transporter periplasmic adaptor subunit [Oceanisphaera marina]|uniref:MexH family multidrug efflux RND transporter periplasmic adaptor subunit n=1 Tax=Oceanisphaera marina TaxID=2017550 RepID=A0ABQ1IJL0_9GAMM|nr:efflux RND transporter periplasmic adaptor subunit [Oceanisphaera marina]GGB43755.1 MexH family multidrug efflux RND transporter periplasmic adaptor subunit [Oceanisphaera marina]
MKKWTLSMLLLVIIIFGSVIGFNLFKQKMMGQYFANMPVPSFPVTTTEITSQDWTPRIAAIGFIEPIQGINISNESAGIVRAIHFESGQQVKAGDTLLEFDADVEKANLRSAQGRLPAVKANLERMRQLFARGSVSRGQLDDAQASYQELLGQVDSLKATIARRTVLAPFDGVMGIRNAFLGQYLNAGTDIARLEDISQFRIRFTIPQTRIADIAVGQSLNIFVDAYPETPFEGEITAIEPQINPDSGVVQVQASIPNKEGKLRSGMFAKLDVQLPTQTAQILVPQQAINFTLYGQTVYVVEEQQPEAGKEQAADDTVLVATQRVIEVAEREEDYARVIKGLKAGETIVTSGQVRLSNGSHVKPVEDDALDTPESAPQL